MERSDPNQFFAEITQVLDKVAQERSHQAVDDRPFRESLRAATARAEELHEAIVAAQDRTNVLRVELAGVFTQIVLHANRFTTQVLESAVATAKEKIGAAQAEGDQAIQSAQMCVEQMLRDAKQQANDTLADAESRAARITNAARADADHVVHEARVRVAEIEQVAEKRVADLIARVEAFAPQQEQISQSLNTLASGYAGLAQEIATLQAEGQGKILPALRDALQAFRNNGGTQLSPSPTQAMQPAEPPTPISPESPKSVRGDMQGVPNNTTRATAPRSGEIVLQQVSHDEAAAFVDALPRLPGVQAALLQTFYQMAEVATIDVLTEVPLNTLAVSELAEFEIEVIGAAEDILTLHVRARHPQRS